MKNKPTSFGCQCGYAETHYKFKLPWSPLWKPWPEVFVDAPSFAIPGAEVPFWLVIKDAHLFPIQLLSLSWTTYHLESKTRTQGSLSDQASFDSYFKFFKLPLDIGQEAGVYQIDFKIEIQNARGQKRVFLNSNYSGVPQQSISVNRLKHPLPYPPQWYAGDLHCHTNISSDQVEFGGDLVAMTEAAACVGLDFWSPTDHSYDFNYDSQDYLKEVSPEEQWEDLQDRIQELSPSLPTVIRGEEVSAGNHLNQNVHFLVIGNQKFFPGLGDGGRRWFNNKPDMSIPEVIQGLDQGVCFAAHPRVRLNPVEGLLLNRGRWHQEDIHEGLHGLQFWNGNQDLSFREGRAFWVQQLLLGKRILPIAGNDAHGDLNKSVGVKWPLFSLWSSQNHVFGQVRTLFPADSSSSADLLKAMQSQTCCITDGPWAGLERQSDDVVKLIFSSNEDWGIIQRLNIFRGKINSKESSEQILVEQFQGDIEVKVNQSDYVRVEIHTSTGRLAMTSALFLDQN